MWGDPLSLWNIDPQWGDQPPFSFTYDGAPEHRALDSWISSQKEVQLDAHRRRTTLTLTRTEPRTGLTGICESIVYDDLSATEWVLYFENRGFADTGLIEDIQVLDITLTQPLSGSIPYILHRTNGAPSNPTDFELSRVPLEPETSVTLSGGGGRSSNRDFPFFRIDGGHGSSIIAVGWSGQWRAVLDVDPSGHLRIRVGMERTRFKLHPHEQVRSPRLLVMTRPPGEDVTSPFRRLLQEHYIPHFQGEPHQPFLYCNTCFTRGGHWLNECDQDNQISLIHALSGLGVQAVITDAGWFEGGWPAGAGNWTPRRDAYPNGMGPVAAAAHERGMQYGLWFEPERVVPGTDLDRDHSDWLLRKKNADDGTPALLNLALPRAQQYFLNIVADFMQLPGFGCYRQDFNMDPLDYWRDNDPEDRQGIAEIRYVEGLYEYWDTLAEIFPDSFRVNCASGGRRIDLESIRRFHVHQKSDYWFDSVVDQATLYALSQYLPNGAVMCPINRLDDYSFHSALAASLCLGWIADDPGFDMDRAKELTAIYLELRHLLTGCWHPLTEYNREPDQWLGSQYHRDDLDEGLLLLFRRESCSQPALSIEPRFLNPDTAYQLTFHSSGSNKKIPGSELMAGLSIPIFDAPGSEMIVYRGDSPA